MVFTFGSPWGQDETCEAIKATVLSMNGRIKDLGRGRLKARWKNNLKRSDIFDNNCTFYVGNGVVRAVTNYPDTETIVMMFRRMTSALKFWNVFVENLLKRYPDADFGIEPGIPELVAIQFLDDGLEQVMVSNTVSRPSWGGAALGGMLFGTAGAIIGGSGGRSYTTTTSRTEVSRLRYAMVRYSNGLVFRGKMINNGSIYQEIMVNMNRLSNAAEK